MLRLSYIQKLSFAARWCMFIAGAGLFTAGLSLC